MLRLPFSPPGTALRAFAASLEGQQCFTFTLQNVRAGASFVQHTYFPGFPLTELEEVAKGTRVDQAATLLGNDSLDTTRVYTQPSARGWRRQCGVLPVRLFEGRVRLIKIVACLQK